MKTEDEFDLFYIDMNRLEETAAEHPFLYVQFCKKLKKLKSKVAKTKANLELVSAELSLAILANPKKFKLPTKPTGPMVKAKVLTRKKYKEALEEDAIANDVHNTYQIYVNAFSHRKSMIRDAVQLHQAQYFAKPYVASSDMRTIIDQLDKKMSRKKMGRKSKKSKK